MIAREYLSIDDTLWTQATCVFHQRGTTVARAIQEFLQRVVEEQADADGLSAAEERGFPAGWGTPENYTLGWIRDFANSYNNASTAAMLALDQASQGAAEGDVAAMSLEEIDWEVTLYRTGG